MQFPATADITDSDTQMSSKCEWTSNHPPGWGSPANAEISVIVRLKLTDAEPDLSAAQDSYQLNSERGSIPDSPPNVLGDASRRSFRPGSDDNSQVATIDFLRANAHVTIRYEGWGNHGFDPQFIPPQAQQAATLDFAQQVAKTLGTPT